MAYNIVLTAQKPTVVIQSIIGNFTGPTDINLIISKCTRLEIHTLTPEGLQGIADVGIYGRIATMELFRPHGETKDLLFLSTERYKFCVLEYDTETGELVTRANGDIADQVGRPCDFGQIGMVDPECRMIGLHLYDGLFKVIPIDEKGQLHEAYNVRLEELAVIDMAFLEGCGRPTLAVLYHDQKDARHVKTYEIHMKDKALADGPWRQMNLDAGANMVIAVPAPLGGAVVVGESVIAYMAKGQSMKVTTIKPTTIKAYGKVDEDGSRYLLGDALGNLLLLVLQHDGEKVAALKTEVLGRVSAPSTLTYLDNGVVYVGSSFGDSQLVRLHATPVSAAEPDNYVEVLETMTNLGPIIDFVVVDLERQGQGQVVMCSGVMADGSLRIVRNGIGMIEQATVELAGIKGMWSLRASYMDAFDTFLVLAFVGETRVLGINADDELGEAELRGFNAGSQTLFCGNTVADQLLQVTRADVRLVDATTLALVLAWQPPPGLQINVASASPSQVLLATGEGNLVFLDVREGKISQETRIQLSAEVSCVDITPLGAGGEASHLAAVGTWDMQVHIYQLPDLTLLVSERLGGEVIPRSVLFAGFEGMPYLLCALGDGQLFNFLVDTSNGALSERKKIVLGTKPIMLRSFRSNGVSYVFAASDRPTVIYSSNKKLLYSNVNENEVNFMTSFNSSGFPDSLAIAKESAMTIGSIDEIQKLHIRTVPLGEQPRRLAHQEQSRSFAVLTSPATGTAGLDDAGPDAVRLLDDQTYETVDRFQLAPSELACSLCSASFADDSGVYYVVGTALTEPEESEPSKGRILVFSARDCKLHLVAEKEVKGAAYNVNPFQGKLIAGVNNKVQLLKWAQSEDGSRELVNESTHTGHVLALYVVTRGDYIVVGDLMRSIQLLAYKAEEGVLEGRARDFKPNWMSAVAALDDDTYLGAENSFNLFTLRKNSDAAADEDRNRLETVGQFHLGDFVNRFQHGSLVMKLPDSEAAKVPTLLFGTLSGAIGVIASLPQPQFQFLARLQDCLRKVVKGVGGLDHAQWRSFQNEHSRAECRGFVDGDLIEQFLDLRREKMEWVAKEMGEGTTVEELVKTVEELSRSCH